MWNQVLTGDKTKKTDQRRRPSANPLKPPPISIERAKMRVTALPTFNGAILNGNGISNLFYGMIPDAASHATH